MKGSESTSARPTSDTTPITIATTIRAIVTTVTLRNIDGIGGTETIIGTTTIRIPVGTTIRIDEPSARSGVFSPRDNRISFNCRIGLFKHPLTALMLPQERVIADSWRGLPSPSVGRSQSAADSAVNRGRS